MNEKNLIKLKKETGIFSDEKAKKLLNSPNSKSQKEWDHSQEKLPLNKLTSKDVIKVQYVNNFKSFTRSNSRSLGKNSVNSTSRLKLGLSKLKNDETNDLRSEVEVQIEKENSIGDSPMFTFDFEGIKIDFYHDQSVDKIAYNIACKYNLAGDKFALLKKIMKEKYDVYISDYVKFK